MKPLALVLALACLGSPRVALASSDASTSALLARARAAAGGDALAELACSRATLRVEMQGLRGSGERIEDHRTGSGVARYDLGALRVAEGFDGDAAWSIEGNNPARIERGADTHAGALSAAYRRSFSHLLARRPGRVEALEALTEGAQRFERLGIAPAGGRPFELWLDAESALPARVVERTASDTLVTTFADWRYVDGIAVPFSIRESNGDARYDTRVTVESVAFEAELPASTFAAPAPPSPDFGIARGAASARVPFELSNNHIFAEVKLAGRAVSALIDTGAVNVITPELARELGLVAQGALEGRGVGEGKVDVGVAQVARVELGDAFLERQTFYVISLGPLAAVEGRAARAILGYEVFRRFPTRIDYDERTLTLHDPARFAYRGPGVAVPIVFDEHTPRIEAEIDGLRGWFDLDTGSRSSLTLAAPFVEAHGLRAKYEPRFAATTGWGVGGASRSELARAGELRLAGQRVRAPVTHLSLQRGGAFAARDLAGNIGGGILRRFDLTLDYANERIFFEPNTLLETPDVFDRSGMWLSDAGEALAVMDVTAGGPAERAGIRTGDRIRAIDGRPVGAGDLLRLRERFRSEAPGTRLRLELEPAQGARREATLELAELV